MSHFIKADFAHYLIPSSAVSPFVTSQPCTSPGGLQALWPAATWSPTGPREHGASLQSDREAHAALVLAGCRAEEEEGKGLLGERKI